MNRTSLSSSSVLSTVLCSDPEQVAGTLPGARRRLLPLSGDFDFFQTSLQLGYLRLVIVQRPPCASEGYLDQRQIGIALALGDSRGLRLDGLSLDQPALVTHGLTIPHRICQPDALTIAAFFMPDVNGDRGWPERTHAARVDPVQPAALQQLRSLVLDVLRLASRDPRRFSRQSVVSGVQQSLLDTVDHAFATAPAERLDDRFHEAGVDETGIDGTRSLLVDSSFEKS